MAEWTSAYISKLPKSSFAWVDPEGNGHLPYKNENGQVDLPHLRNALARLNQVKGMSSSEQVRVREHLQKVLAEHKGDGEEVYRFDRSRITNIGVDANGMLRANAKIARVGVFKYVDSDGSSHVEYVPEETLFDPEWMRSMSLVPVTRPHPPEFVTAQNASKYQVGTTGEVLARDGDHLGSVLLVSHADAVEAVKGGEHELSCGYTCQLDWTEGQWQGQRYDAIQRHRKGNHLAIVEKGRHGPTVRIAMDSAIPNVAWQEDSMAENKTPKKDEDLGGMDDDTRAKIARHDDDIKKLCDDMDDLKRRHDDLRQKHDDLMRKHDDLHGKHVKLKRDYDDLVGKHDDLRSRHDGLHGKHDDLDTRHDDTRRKHDDLARKHDDTRRRVDDLDKKMGAVHRDQSTEVAETVKVLDAAKKIMGDEWSGDGKTIPQMHREVVAKVKPALELNGKTDADLATIYEVVSVDALDSIEADRRRGGAGNSGQSSRTVNDNEDPVRGAAMSRWVV